MKKADEIFLCVVCENAVTLIHKGAGTLMCCGQPMVPKKKVPLKLTKKIA